MALVITDIGGGREMPTGAGTKAKLFKITGDGAYSAGGTAITAAQFGFTNLYAISDAISAGRISSWNQSTGKLQTFRGNTAANPLAEDTTADQSASIFYVKAIGD